MQRIKYISLIILSLVGLSLSAQQMQQATQYQWMGLGYNPAFAGSDNFFNVYASHRTQWAGIDDAPRTYQLGLHAPSKSGKMGFGGHIITDVAGPTKRFGAQGVYAYHLQVSETSKISLGASFGLTQFTIDGSQITLRESGDKTLDGSTQSELKPDASFGALWYGEKFKAGVSATQILNNKLDLFPGDGEGNMAVHYYFTGSYLFNVSDVIDIEPSTLVKYVNPTPVQFDVSSRVIYKKHIWLGVSYRTSDAVAIFAGYKMLDYLTLGYSFDYTTSDIQTYTNGTHEILIQVRFGKKQMVDKEN